MKSSLFRNIRSIIRKARRLYWRVRLGLKMVDPTFLAGGFSRISRDFQAGPYSYVGPECLICSNVSIGKYTMIGPRVMIVGNDHVFDIVGEPIIFSGRPPLMHTRIGDDVWMGGGTIVMAGVTIGSGSIIAAGSIVTKDVPECVVVGGVPAKLIRYRFESDTDKEEHIKGIAKKRLTFNYCDRR